MRYLKLTTFIATIILCNSLYAQSKHSCSSFQLSSGDTVVVGHNLDEYFTVPGMVVVNPRNIKKENISWYDLRKGKKKNQPRVQWTSKYGSITYNTFGREFIDGGINEAGLYVGEMTLMETEYYSDITKPTFYHCFWMQYLLDNYASVNEVIENLTTVCIDGHSRWHFFIADKTGDVATIEFIKGKPVIHRGENLPHNILCNSAYNNDLDSLKLYKGYGGERIIDINDKENTKRTVRATELIRIFNESKPKPIVDYSFDMLTSLNLGNNQWQIVCDLTNQKMYFKTVLCNRIKYTSIKEFNFDSKNQRYIDIHSNLENDITNNFLPLTAKTNKKYVRKTWWAIDFGFFGNIFFKPFVVLFMGAKMSNYTSEFYLNE